MSTLLSINNYYYRRGGAEVVFLEHGRLFEAMGWTVVPFAMHHEKNLPSTWSRHFAEELEFGRTYSWVDKWIRASRVIYSRDARRCVKNILAEVKPTIAHVHNIYHHLSPAILPLLKQAGIPVVMTLHDLKLACPAYKMLTADGKICEKCRDGRIENVIKNRCIKGSFSLSSLIYVETMLHRFFELYNKYVDRFVVPSKFYINKFAEWGWDVSKFVHIPNFANSEDITPNYCPGSRFVYIGRLSAEKGLPTLMAAAARAKVGVTIVGSGPQEAELMLQSKKLGADVVFLGHLSGAELSDVVSNARAVVLPSEWYENAPLCITEAYAHGKPVIGADIGGIPELIQENVTGYTFPSGDVQALSQVLVKVSRMDHATLQIMGQQGRAVVDNEFSATRYRERLSTLYQSLMVA